MVSNKISSMFVVTEAEVHRMDDLINTINYWNRILTTGSIIQAPFDDPISLDHFEFELVQTILEEQQLAQQDLE